MSLNTKECNFADATTIKAESSHTYAALFPDDWCIGSVPHGGYVTACFLQVASTHFSTTLSTQNQPHTITLHLDFLRRTQSGPALFTVRDVKLGRQTTVIHVTLSQDGRDEVVGYITNSNFDTESGVTYPTAWKLTPPALPVDLQKLGRDEDKNWIRQPEMPFAEFRKATTKCDFHFPREGQRVKSTADEWIRMTTGEKWTNASLGYISDMWPMPIEAYIHSSEPYDVYNTDKKALKLTRFWYPTLLLNLDFKKSLPEEGVEWIFVRVDTRQIKNGRMDMDVTIMDEGGDIIALSQHVGFAMDSTRNTAKRRTGAESKI